MSIADWKGPHVASDTCPALPTGPPRRLHRVKEVREQQGVSLRSAARRMGVDPSEARVSEDESADMPLSLLYLWREALEVPVASLLVEAEDPLSEPILKRARMVRLMKTAVAIQEKADSDAVARLSQMLVEQLVELMPELAEVSAWHAVGQRRSLDEMGRVAEQALPDDWFHGST